MEKVPWDMGRDGAVIGGRFGGARGRERADAKKTCFLAGQGWCSLFQGHSSGGATDVSTVHGYFACCDCADLLSHPLCIKDNGEIGGWCCS